MEGLHGELAAGLGTLLEMAELQSTAVESLTGGAVDSDPIDVG